MTFGSTFGHFGALLLHGSLIHILILGPKPQLKETLPKEARRKTWSMTNPFAFIRLFTSGAQLRKLSMVTRKNTGAIDQIYDRTL
jgi:hypothetical protein